MSVKKIHIFPSEESYVTNSGSVEADDLALVPLNNKAYVTETWHSGTSWYRVWSDGWIEQGGTYTSGDNNGLLITLSKKMTTTYYHCAVTGGYNTACNYAFGYCYNKTTSNFKAVVIEPGGTWYVCGY